MADIELVIKIPDHLYKLLKEFPSDSNEGNIENVLMKAVEHGTPLPKGHGALKDVDKLKLDVFEYDEDAWMWASITKSGYSKEQIESLETIIEADKEQEK